MRTKVYTNYKWYKQTTGIPCFITVQVNPYGIIESMTSLQNNKYTVLPLTNIINVLGQDFINELQEYGVKI